MPIDFWKIGKQNATLVLLFEFDFRGQNRSVLNYSFITMTSYPYVFTKYALRDQMHSLEKNHADVLPEDRQTKPHPSSFIYFLNVSFFARPLMT